MIGSDGGVWLPIVVAVFLLFLSLYEYINKKGGGHFEDIWILGGCVPSALHYLASASRSLLLTELCRPL